MITLKLITIAVLLCALIVLLWDYVTYTRTGRWLLTLTAIVAALGSSACSKGMRFSVALEPMTKGEYHTGFEPAPKPEVATNTPVITENPVSFSGGKASWLNW